MNKHIYNYFWIVIICIAGNLLATFTFDGHFGFTYGWALAFFYLIFVEKR